MKTYDTAHMLHHLRQWQSAMQAAEQRLDELSELTGINRQWPLQTNAMNALFRRSEISAPNAPK